MTFEARMRITHAEGVAAENWLCYYDPINREESWGKEALAMLETIKWKIIELLVKRGILAVAIVRADTRRNLRGRR